jgi:hypothetical protein
MPGMKNVAGDMVELPLIPPHPAANNATMTTNAKLRIFPSIRTWLI